VARKSEVRCSVLLTSCYFFGIHRILQDLVQERAADCELVAEAL
jgi:hypothetical protein